MRIALSIFLISSRNLLCTSIIIYEYDSICCIHGFIKKSLFLFASLVEWCTMERSVTTCCCCCKGNPVTANSVRVDRTGYMPGDTIYVDAAIYDGSAKNIKQSYIQHVKVRVHATIYANCYMFLYIKCLCCRNNIRVKVQFILSSLFIKRSSEQV